MDEMNEFNSISETDDRRDTIKQKLRQYYDGRIVRKDLTKSIREGANVPVYVLEKITKAYNLPYDYVIHTVGPIWNGGKQNEEELLANCYYNSMMYLFMKLNDETEIVYVVRIMYGGRNVHKQLSQTEDV